jgi:hypothetical protein
MQVQFRTTLANLRYMKKALNDLCRIVRLPVIYYGKKWLTKAAYAFPAASARKAIGLGQIFKS